MTAHDHAEYVEGCFRCDLSRDEPLTAEKDALACGNCGAPITFYNPNCCHVDACSLCVTSPGGGDTGE